MRRFLPVLLTIVVILTSIASFLYFNQLGSTAMSGIATSTGGRNIPVGVVLYPWYGNATGDVGGLGTPGWNSTSCPGGGSVVDRPNFGYYASDSNQTFRTQIGEMQDAGLSFAVVSWWGPFDQGEAGAVNKASLDLFRYLQSTNSSFKVAIMVDAFTSACGLPNLPMAQVYDYVQITFVSPYRHWYFQWQGKPLLLFFNPLLPGSNGNFTVRTVGNRPNTVDWSFWDAPGNFSQGQGGTGVNVSNDIGNPYVSTDDGEVTIVPRIDSYYNYVDGYQSGYLRFDSNLHLGLYQYEWNYVLSHSGEVKLILIYSWNEYHERTAIEPHVDGSSTLSGNYLLNVTMEYVNQLERPRG